MSIWVNLLCYPYWKAIIKSKVELQYKSPLVNSVLGTMSGCTGGGHPTMQSYNPFRGLHLMLLPLPLSQMNGDHCKDRDRVKFLQAPPVEAY